MPYHVHENILKELSFIRLSKSIYHENFQLSFNTKILKSDNKNYNAELLCICI